MTAEQWDVHWFRVYNLLRVDGVAGEVAREQADAETVEQFGPRPVEPA